MGCYIQRSSFCQRNRLSLALLLFLLILSSTHARLIPQGKATSNLIEDDAEMGIRRERSLIGSRPPRCERKCRGCSHCEAVQVPIVPIRQKQQQQQQQVSLITRRSEKNQHQQFIPNSRGDDISNYKPMCWKCKCGDFFFNP